MQERPSVKKLLAYEKEVNEVFAKTAQVSFGDTRSCRPYSRIARRALNSFIVENLFLAPNGDVLRCQSNVTECQDKHRLRHYYSANDSCSPS